MGLKRGKYLHFRVSEVERQALRALCDQEAIGLSESCRLALREAALRRGLWPPAGEDGQKVGLGVRCEDCDVAGRTIDP